MPLVKNQLPELEDAQILAEPAQLSTAPAAAWASWYISQRDPEACIVASPADQFITNEAAFEQELLQGLDYVREHPQFLAMSVKATTPNTAYGYLQKGNSIDQKRFMRKSFTEKPPIEFAKTFVSSGEFLWNTGLFLWHVQTMASHVPQLLPSFGLSAVEFSEEEVKLALQRYYPAAEYNSIDSVLLDRDWPTVVQECSFGWRDVGSWPVMKEVQDTDAGWQRHRGWCWCDIPRHEPHFGASAARHRRCGARTRGLCGGTRGQYAHDYTDRRTCSHATTCRRCPTSSRTRVWLIYPSSPIAAWHDGSSLP